MAYAQNEKLFFGFEKKIGKKFFLELVKPKLFEVLLQLLLLPCFQVNKYKYSILQLSPQLSKNEKKECVVMAGWERERERGSE